MMYRNWLLTAFTSLGILLSVAIETQAQALSPMRGVIQSGDNQFAIQVFAGNPYNRPIKVTMTVFDQDFRPIKAKILPEVSLIGSRGKRRVLVIVPFEGHQTRKVRVCAETIHGTATSTKVKARVCGRFLARHM